MIKAVIANLPIRCTTVLMLFAVAIRILAEASAVQIVDHSGLHERELSLRGTQRGRNLVGPSAAGARLLRFARNDGRF
jgi:hypothetical protein